MMMHEQIEEKLITAFHPRHMEVHDESHRHHVPEGAESHFRVVIVSDSFTDQRPLQRHRAVYGVLAEALAGSVHALALHTYTPTEWESASGNLAASPPCYGGKTSI